MKKKIIACFLATCLLSGFGEPMNGWKTKTRKWSTRTEKTQKRDRKIVNDLKKQFKKIARSRARAARQFGDHVKGQVKIIFKK